MALKKPNHRLSEAQYLDMERAADFKSEFFDGEMFAMAGGSQAQSHCVKFDPRIGEQPEGTAVRGVQ